MRTSAEKRFSPMKFTKSTKERLQAYSPHRKVNKLHSSNYFCHYSNAVYMGGADCFKKSGQGILLIDNGACVLSSHSHDNMVGHNIIFQDRSLTSLIIDLNKAKDICLRTGPYLLNVLMSSKNQIEGPGLLIDYRLRKVFKLQYQRSSLLKKIKVNDEQMIKGIFEEQNLLPFLAQEHIHALNFIFNLPSEINCVKNGNSFAFGFCESWDAKKGYIVPNGLAFRIECVNKPEQSFDILLEERGYFEKNGMTNFGQQHFSNGNFYVGGFLDGKFEGKGLLVYPKQQKWTYGKYSNGELVEVQNSSIQNTRSLGSVLKQIHEYSKPYIQGKITINPSEKQLIQILKIVVDSDPYEHESIDYLRENKNREENLKKIQEDFVSKHYQHRTQQAIKKALDKSEKLKKNNKLRTINVVQAEQQATAQNAAKVETAAKVESASRSNSKQKKLSASQKPTSTKEVKKQKQLLTPNETITQYFKSKPREETADHLDKKYQLSSRQSPFKDKTLSNHPYHRYSNLPKQSESPNFTRSPVKFQTSALQDLEYAALLNRIYREKYNQIRDRQFINLTLKGLHRNNLEQSSLQKRKGRSYKYLFENDEEEDLNLRLLTRPFYRNSTTHL